MVKLLLCIFDEAGRLTSMALFFSILFRAFKRDIVFNWAYRGNEAGFHCYFDST